jgi:hypothetical protein
MGINKTINKKLEGMGLTSQRYAPDNLSCRKYL